MNNNPDDLNKDDQEYFAEGIMLYNEEDPVWRKELMIAQIMVYLQKGNTQDSLNILYGKEHVDTAISILKPGLNRY